jgi:hypothetical protein
LAPGAHEHAPRDDGADPEHGHEHVQRERRLVLRVHRQVDRGDDDGQRADGNGDRRTPVDGDGEHGDRTGDRGRGREA